MGIGFVCLLSSLVYANIPETRNWDSTVMGYVGAFGWFFVLFSMVVIGIILRIRFAVSSYRGVKKAAKSRTGNWIIESLLPTNKK